jgi:hypothetical protein
MIRRELRVWLPKLKPCAVLMGHDYCDQFGVK